MAICPWGEREFFGFLNFFLLERNGKCVQCNGVCVTDRACVIGWMVDWLKF